MLAEEAEEGEAERAAQLYIWLRCGFAFLPSGTAVAPQWRRNYESALEVASDITLELRRLIQQGHLIDFDEARRRFASCRHLSRPTIVLAMGLIRKLNEDGTEKLRVVLDASGEDASGVSLNNLIDIDNFPTKLPSVQRYADALALLGPRAQLFKVDLTDSYFCFPISDDSVPLVGIYWQGRFLVYHSLVFGVNSSVHAFQLLSIAVSRGCMRRWRAAGIHCFDAPSLVDQSQPWPSAHPALPRRGSRAMSAPDIRYDDVRRDHTTMDDSSMGVIQASQPEVASPEVTTHLTDPMAQLWFHRQTDSTCPLGGHSPTRDTTAQHSFAAIDRQRQCTGRAGAGVATPPWTFLQQAAQQASQVHRVCTGPRFLPDPNPDLSGDVHALHAVDAVTWHH
jgi:hypothetical protein